MSLRACRQCCMTEQLIHPLSLCSHKPMPRTRVPARGELITIVMLLLSSEESNQVLSESCLGWSSGCSGFSSSSVSPTWKHGRVGRTHHLRQQASRTAEGALNGTMLRKRGPGIEPAPGSPLLTDLQQLDRGHLTGLWWRAALLGSIHLLPNHPGAAGGSLCHPQKRRKVVEGQWVGSA